MNRTKKIFITTLILGLIAVTSGTAGLIYWGRALSNVDAGWVMGIMNELENIELEPQTGTGYYVTKVIDGDTFDVEIDGKREKVRMIGIDTPELKGSECYSKEAKAELELLIESKFVELSVDYTQADKDRYGRLLRYVNLENRDINQYMVENGFAYEYTYDNAYLHQFKYRQAEQSAESVNKGLWKICI
jgi:endonuclease YncB( thermonuclease family)